MFGVPCDGIVDSDQSAVGSFPGQSVPDEVNLIPVFACIDPASAVIPEEIKLTVEAFSHYEFVYRNCLRIMTW